jgi:hypothetical protein
LAARFEGKPNGEKLFMNRAHPSPTEIATAITQLFDSLLTRLGDKRTDGERTTQLKADIGNLGLAHDWGVCASGGFENEWLYDLIWYRNAC